MKTWGYNRKIYYHILLCCSFNYFFILYFGIIFKFWPNTVPMISRRQFKPMVDFSRKKRLSWAILCKIYIAIQHTSVLFWLFLCCNNQNQYLKYSSKLTKSKNLFPHINLTILTRNNRQIFIKYVKPYISILSQNIVCRVQLVGKRIWTT